MTVLDLIGARADMREAVVFERTTNG